MARPECDTPLVRKGKALLYEPFASTFQKRKRNPKENSFLKAEKESREGVCNLKGLGYVFFYRVWHRRRDS